MPASLAALAVGTMVTLSGIAWGDGDSGRSPLYPAETIRLWAAQAPECATYHTYRHPCDDGGPGEAATRFASSMTDGHSVVGIIRGRDGDRPVMQVFVIGEAGTWRDLASEMFLAGHACVMERFTPYREYRGEAASCEWSR